MGTMPRTSVPVPAPALTFALPDPPPIWVLLAYWLVSAPAYGLAGALALRNLPRPSEQFGGVRLWGTVGWMAVGWLVWAMMAASGSWQTGRGVFEAFWVAAALSAAFALYSWFPSRLVGRPSGRGLLGELFRLGLRA